jgi:hypothetical protein
MRTNFYLVGRFSVLEFYVESHMIEFLPNQMFIVYNCKRVTDHQTDHVEESVT